MNSMGETCKNAVLSDIHGEGNTTVLKYFQLFEWPKRLMRWLRGSRHLPCKSGNEGKTVP